MVYRVLVCNECSILLDNWKAWDLAPGLLFCLAKNGVQGVLGVHASLVHGCFVPSKTNSL